VSSPISQNLELRPPRSPISDDDPPSETETEDQRQVKHDRLFDEFL
jgi:hypothetical protein